MNKKEVAKEFQERFLALRKFLNEMSLIPGAPKDEFDHLNHKVLSHLYKGADHYKISLVLESELIVRYGLTVDTETTTKMAEEILDWWQTL